MTRRAKLFGLGRATPLDRNQKAKLLHLARDHRRAKRLTSKGFEVLEALLIGFHNAKSGACFPSYEKIAELVGCARSTVALALKALEILGLMTWHHRLYRTAVRGLVKVCRTSNAYQFPVLARAAASKSENEARTKIQSLSIDADTPLMASVRRLGELRRQRALFTGA